MIAPSARRVALAACVVTCVVTGLSSCAGSTECRSRGAQGGGSVHPGGASEFALIAWGTPLFAGPDEHADHSADQRRQPATGGERAPSLFAIRVLDTRGEFVRIDSGADHAATLCAPRLGGLDGVEGEVYVRSVDLVPTTARLVERSFADGSSIRLAPGVSLLRTEEGLRVIDGPVDLPVPALPAGDLAPRFSPHALDLPAAAPDQAAPEHADLVYGDQPEPLSRSVAPALSFEDGYWTLGTSCVQLRVRAEPPRQPSAAQPEGEEQVRGWLAGLEVEEADGVGGLGLIGASREGGGTGEGTIGLGSSGLIAEGGGVGCAYCGECPPEAAGRSKLAAVWPTQAARDRFAEAHGPQVQPGKPWVLGPLDSDIVRRIVRAHLDDLRSCYVLGLQGDPGLRGRLVITFEIEASGQVAGARVHESNLADQWTASCVTKSIMRWEFPAPRGQGSVEVRYPLELAPGEH